MRVLFACTRGAGHFNPVAPFAHCVPARRRTRPWSSGRPSSLRPSSPPGCPSAPGAAPPEEEDGAGVGARAFSLSYEDAERLVIGEIFATLKRARDAARACARRSPRVGSPDVVVREPAEIASAVAAEEAGVAPRAGRDRDRSSAHRADHGLCPPRRRSRRGRPGLTDRIAATPYLTLFPSGSWGPPSVAGSPLQNRHRFRDPAAVTHRTRPLLYCGLGDERSAGLRRALAARSPAEKPLGGLADLRGAAEGRRRTDCSRTADDGACRSEEVGPPSAARRARARRALGLPRCRSLPHAARRSSATAASGTTLGTLAAGVPLVVTPLFADQPVNGNATSSAAGAGLRGRAAPTPSRHPDGRDRPRPRCARAILTALREAALGRRRGQQSRRRWPRSRRPRMRSRCSRACGDRAPLAYRERGGPERPAASPEQERARHDEGDHHHDPEPLRGEAVRDLPDHEEGCRDPGEQRGQRGSAPGRRRCVRVSPPSPYATVAAPRASRPSARGAAASGP